MDIQTRVYLKNLVDDASDANLLISVLQRFNTAMSENEIFALRKAISLLSAEAVEYLGIGSDGKLVNLEEVPLDDLGPGPTDELDDEELPPVAGVTQDEQPPAKKPKKKDYS